MKMLISFGKNIVLYSVIIILLGVISCSKNKKEKQIADIYSDWKTYSYQNIKFYYPPGHFQEKFIPELAQKYIVSIRKDCQFLHINIPEDTLIIFFYTGLGQGKKITGHEYPYAQGDTIHLWMPSYFGSTVMKYLLPKWNKKEPRYQFLKHGLYALFDYSGKNYHKETLDYLKKGKLIPLKKLAVDTTINSNRERHQSAEAASFVDFVVFYYGINTLRNLYNSRDSFEKSVTHIFNISVDSLQNTWLTVIKKSVK